jgi:hypothetical protein
MRKAPFQPASKHQNSSKSYLIHELENTTIFSLQCVSEMYSQMLILPKSKANKRQILLPKMQIKIKLSNNFGSTSPPLADDT